MSGMCGIVRFDGGPVARDELMRMARAAEHRGPDGIYPYCSDSVGVVALELNLRGDAGGESRPRIGGDFICVCDARLDNPEELSATYGRNDCERILGALVGCDGGNAASILGDFAVALFDRRSRSLHLLRDPMGMRSLYYRVEADRVLFATEIRQIFAAGGIDRALNDEAAAWYLCGMQVPSGCVFYRGIREVLPGEEVSFFDRGCNGNASGRLRTHSRMFWEPDPARRIRFRDDREYEEAFRELLVRCMRSRLRTSSPAGVSLSGGIDSGTIASIAGRLGEEETGLASLRAYSWVFESLPQCDESENIRRIAGRFSLPVTRIRAEEAWPLLDYPARLPHFDDPFTSMFQPVMDRVLTHAKADGVRQMFYGFRGDVMCGGNVNDLPGLLRSGHVRDTVRELNELSRIFNERRTTSFLRYLLRPALSDLVPREIAIALRNGRFSGPQARAACHVRRSFLARAGLPDRDPVRVRADVWPRSDARNRYIHIYSPLVTRGVAYTERLTAESGMGFADPWSDRRIAEFILACPQHIVDRALEVKRLAKRAGTGIMPEEARLAADKVSPEPHYLHTLRFEAREKVRELITDSRCAALGYVDEAALTEQFNRFVNGDMPRFDLWSTLSLEMWLRSHWD